MKIRSAILTEMSGKLGGAVGATARGGVQYLRKLVFPGNPRSTRQSFIRAALTGIAAAWTNDLNDVQRAAWTNLAGDNESGIDIYVRNNVQVSRAALTRVDVAPATKSTAYANTPSIVNDQYVEDGGAANISITNGKRALATGAKINVYASSGNQNPSRLAQQHPFQYITTITQDGTTTAPTIDLNAFLESPWATGTGPDTKIGYVRLVGVKVTGEVTQDLIFRLPNDEA